MQSATLDIQVRSVRPALLQCRIYLVFHVQIEQQYLLEPFFNSSTKDISLLIND
jgi:hypothetical protein